MGRALRPPAAPRLGTRKPARRRSLEVRALAALLSGAALCLLVAVLFPMSSKAPVALGWAALVLALAMAGGTFVVGDRVPRWCLIAEVSVAAILNSGLVAFAHTTGGATGDAFAYLWMTAWVALFFPRGAAPFAVLCSVGYAAGLLASGLPRMVAIWALVTVATGMIAVLVSRVSRLMRRHLRTDALTGALNRSGLAEVAGRVPRRRREDDEIAVAALDLDGFKQVNDREGHAAGDRLLADATAAWQRELRADDVLARIGGDEFVLVMPGTSPREAAAVLDRLRASHPVDWSAGVTHWRDGEPLERCLQRADERLYAAKASRD